MHRSKAELIIEPLVADMGEATASSLNRIRKPPVGEGAVAPKADPHFLGDAVGIGCWSCLPTFGERPVCAGCGASLILICKEDRRANALDGDYGHLATARSSI
jgi:hypothetical protein